MNEAVDRVIIEREAMDRGFSRSLVLSAVVHVLLVGAPLVASLLLPQKPPIQVLEFAVFELPRGGGGTPDVEAPAPAQPQHQAPPETAPPQPKAEPPKVVKPPKEEKKKGLPELDAKKGKRPKPEQTPPPRAASGAQGGTGKATGIPGVTIGPPGPGTPDGVDVGGDWYLASVQQKIWMIWTQQIKADFTQAVAVTFTILDDGQVEGVEVTQPSGATLIDLAAKRAVYSAGPFGPLPKHYGTNRITIQAIFKPTP